MFLLFLSLTIASALSLVGGFAWAVLASHNTAKECAGKGAEVDETEEDVFVGASVSVKCEGSISVTDLKKAILEGDWGNALPWVLGMLGLIGIMIFGGLTALAAAHDKMFCATGKPNNADGYFIGGVLLVMGLSTIWMVAKDMRNC